MDLQPTPEQELLDTSVTAALRRHAGVRRAHEQRGALDQPLVDALDGAGYLDVGYDAGAIEALLVTERCAEAAACAPIAARVLIAPLAGIDGLPSLVTVACGPGLVRYAADAEAFLVLDGDRAFVAAPDDVKVETVRSASQIPLGRVVRHGGRDLGPGSGDRLRRAWQVGLAAEMASTALAAVELATDHVRDRHQFGRAIGSFQAVQHRLARAYAMAHATRWLARRAAWFVDDEFMTASAATFACQTAELTYNNTHQVCGGIGITSEFGLVHHTTRLLVLQRELGGRRLHARRVAATRHLSPTCVPATVG